MKKLKILYEDKQLLILEKSSGELTISTPKEKVRTLYAEASAYVKKQYPKNKVFVPEEKLYSPPVNNSTFSLNVK